MKNTMKGILYAGLFTLLSWLLATTFIRQDFLFCGMLAVAFGLTVADAQVAFRRRPQGATSW